jgi:biotin carboxyl carrier protein
MRRQDVVAEVAGKIWKVEVKLDQAIEADDILFIVESMKMEIPISTPHAGKVLELRVAEGESVREGQIVAVIETGL